MKKNINSVLILVDVVAISFASIWFYVSRYDFEPLILIITLLSGLLALLFRRCPNNNSEGELPISNKQIQKGGKRNVQVGGNYTREK